MCDVPSIAVFCSESIDCFPGTASKFFFKLLVTIPVAPITIGLLLLLYYSVGGWEEEAGDRRFHDDLRDLHHHIK
jgi:hypothetical protein